MIAALVNHLWQSTLFALCAGLLTLALRRNGAGVRYGLWFAASVKFLVPFALLAAAGGYAAERLHLALPASRDLAAIAPVVEPFAPAHAVTFPGPLRAAPLHAAPAVVASAPLPAPRAAAVRFDPAPILLGVWALGLIAVLLTWGLRWSRIRDALRAARPARLPAPVPVLSTPFPMEPGVVGVRWPVLIVPDGIAEHLSPAEWKAVLAHELSHIRRHDNLTGLVHMLVQALFWFHPLVWWLGSRLVAERERACDEAVVGGGADARTYAAGILKICRLYARQPLACAAGVSGSDLKARVQAIIYAPPARPLSLLKKGLLLAAGAGAIATPVTAGLLSSPEGRTAVARAAAAASSALGAAAAPPADRAPAARPVVLARNERVLPPTLAITRTAAAPEPLSTDLPAAGAAQVARSPEDAVRRWILALQTNQSGLVDMTPAVEQSALEQWGLARQMFRAFGALKELRLTGSMPDGEDAYQADFAHGKIQVLVGPLTADGKIARLAWGPLWSQVGAAPTPGRPMPPLGMQAPLYRWGPSQGDDRPAPPPAAPPAPAAGTASLPVTKVALDASALPPAPPLEPHETYDFVKSYAQSSLDPAGIPRWGDQLCIQVGGLVPDQAALITARIAEVARAAGVSVAPSGCRLANVVVAFTSNPQVVLDREAARRGYEPNLAARHGWIVGRRVGDSQVTTQPVQVWYRAVVADSGGTATTRLPNDPSLDMYCNSRLGCSLQDMFQFVLVVVDLNRVKDLRAAAVADFVAMTALSQPQALDRCNVLPSITDLFAGACPGRASPSGLTAADMAYLRGLYSTDPTARDVWARQSAIADRMAVILAGDRVAAR